jgi:hypothetical protein
VVVAQAHPCPQPHDGAQAQAVPQVQRWAWTPAHGQEVVEHWQDF